MFETQTITIGTRTLNKVTRDEAIAAGDTDGDRWLQALKVQASERAADEAENYRGRFVKLRPGKLAEYQVLAPIAKAAAAGVPEALGMLSGLAAARGSTPEQEAARINELAKRYIGIVLVIAELEARTIASIKAAINPAGVLTALATGDQAAKLKFAEIMAATQGGA